MGDCDDKSYRLNGNILPFAKSTLYIQKENLAATAFATVAAADASIFNICKTEQDSLDFSTSIFFAHLYSDLFAIDTVRVTAFAFVAAHTFAAAIDARL